ncbi:hypothetical protein GX48_00245 [Paracoccidioides brasiliensis]|nr:hypothetical protein GX48_00245 [Paracoccidioides brasiliensis]
MGCSNSTHVGEESDADRRATKTLNPSTASTLLPNFHSETLEAPSQTGLSMEYQLAVTAVTDAYIEETREFEMTLMEITNEIFTEQYGDPNVAAFYYVPEGTAVPEEKMEPAKECRVCFQAVSVHASLLYPCKRCTEFTCSDCLRKMFTTACVDESRMPPRGCCGPLNIGVAVSVLTSEEILRFKAKHEEWSTANRVYCPVPTCSAFIPYRLFPPDYRPTALKLAKPEVKENPPSTLSPAQLQTPPPTPPSLPSSPRPQHASISCPECAIEICCACKQMAHLGALCPEDAGELDPELAKLLKQWKVKRCPKCRGAVRRMYGCSHIACRCGDQWCWHCTQPIEWCHKYGCIDNISEDDDDDSYDDDGDDENEYETRNQGEGEAAPAIRDLDRGGRYRWNDRDHDFGEEPVLHHYDPFDCYHRWTKAETSDVNDRQNYACERCWRDIAPRQFTYPEVAELMEQGFILEKPIVDGENHEISNLRLFLCNRCMLMLCDDCQVANTAEKVARRQWERV